ncbi:MAG: hypothetical protein U1E45_01345 [Geminicoccaceae bacterium]
MMLRAAVFGGVLGALALAASGAKAQDTYDNPASDDVPCVVVSHYEAKPVKNAGPGHYHAIVTLENVCDRSMEARLCLAMRDLVAKDEDRCFAGVVRPRGYATVNIPDAAVRVVDKTLQWRYAP